NSPVEQETIPINPNNWLNTAKILLSPPSGLEIYAIPGDNPSSLPTCFAKIKKYDQGHDVSSIVPERQTWFSWEDDLNLETLSLLWLDENVQQTNDNKLTQEKLRTVINCLKMFNKEAECKEYIQKAKQEKIVLVVSGRLGQIVIPAIHALPQMAAIYIYCQNKLLHEKWSEEYPKINKVICNPSELVSRIQTDQHQRNKFDDTLPLNIYVRSEQQPTDGSVINLDKENAEFMWFQLFIDTLLRLKYSDEKKYASVTKLVCKLKQNYKDDPKELEIIDEFARTHFSTNAVRWYTKECCIYRLLNKALSIKNIDFLFEFRFLIHDIYDQLKLAQEYGLRDITNSITFYRGQIISNDELDRIKNSIGGFISMNSFLSTSRNQQQAILFVQTATKSRNFQPVLFNIKVNQNATTKPFADISCLSTIPNGNEILFMLGSVFRIKNVGYDREHHPYVDLEFDDYNLTSIYFKQNKIDDETNLLTLFHLLFKMGEYNKAESFIKRVLSEPDEYEYAPKLTIECYNGLGQIAEQKKDFKQALHYYYKALDFIKNRSLSLVHPLIARSFIQVGLVHFTNGNIKLANDYLNIALYIYSTLTKDADRDLDVAKCYYSIGDIYNKAKKSDLAFINYDKALKIYKNITKMCSSTGNYLSALQYSQKALKIFENSLPCNPNDIRAIHNIPGLSFEQLKVYEDLKEMYDICSKQVGQKI
ncbi:unnamed protein product, partial [Didymodactylos carnosus]